MDVYEISFSLKKPFGRIRLNPGGWDEGEVITPFGIVSVYAQGDENNVHHTAMDFAFNGRFYHKSFQKRRYSQRYMVTKANQFA